ncbi:MAG: hypothetical protein IT168_23435 [Bryobacterales bacterium]|nr:hypothetical protein [Bryobacterales bacterium]
MLTRRLFLSATAVAAVSAQTKMTPRQRVDRALAGQPVDRPPISLWHHFGLEKQGPAKHAEATLAFHRSNRTDLVKVMSDFPFPKPAAGAWWEVKEQKSPFAPQLEALTIINKQLGGSAHFVETIFNPWNQAEKISSKEEVKRMMTENPQRLLNALEAIAKSEANHARLALQKGASGIFLAIANADPAVMTFEQYRKFSEPFDRMVLAAASSAPLNVMHIHGDKVYLDHFLSGWPQAVINYSVSDTKVSLAATRKKFAGVLAGGIDEDAYPKLSIGDLKSQAAKARQEVGAKFILTPGCSVPNDTPADKLKLLAQAVG